MTSAVGSRTGYAWSSNPGGLTILSPAAATLEVRIDEEGGEVPELVANHRSREGNDLAIHLGHEAPGGIVGKEMSMRSGEPLEGCLVPGEPVLAVKAALGAIEKGALRPQVGLLGRAIVHRSLSRVPELGHRWRQAFQRAPIARRPAKLGFGAGVREPDLAVEHDRLQVGRD